ncbi:hypothetical protein [Sedimenticola thiotaurini]|uniref:SHOCT domain-containing protein n=1 Tax=Sedimenticola thiotaurini TaxID=1543721 RepID=A0A0F7JWR6_9GAMM|nr:hypothetical protein [Sedimenticola thiotaurini]AKH19205.1 hypothetical protein AAY24_01330 [Sedimenticola thiotaurini]
MTLEDQLIKVATGLAFIIPGILLLRWWLTRSTGSPEEWAEYHIRILEQKYAKGEIDDETYRTRLNELQNE